jgi:sugar phosphate isomerase/epimerase
MLVMTRRSFFQKTGVTAVAFGILQSQVTTLKAALTPLGLPLGSQTYPHALRVNCDFAGLLKDMKALGIDAIELCNPAYGGGWQKLADGKATRKIADDNGIKVLSCHFQMNSLRTDLPKQVAWAQELGMIQMCTATMSGRVSNGTTTEDEIKRAAYEYNKIAEGAKNAGMQQILHNEGFENSRLVDGRLTYPVLLQYLDPELVKMQFQMSGMTTVGNPIMYFQNYPGRFASAHLQGVNTTNGMRVAGPPALPTKPTAEEAAAAAARGGGGGRAAGGPAVDPCAPAAAPAAGRAGAAPAGGRGGGNPPLALGEDTVNWPAVFAAGKIGGLKTIFIEQNWDATVKSAAYLKTLT